MCLESSRKLAVFTYVPSSPEGRRSTNKNKNNNTLYLWGSFLPGLLLTHPVYLFCVLEASKDPEPGKSAPQILLYRAGFLEALHLVLHSLIHALGYLCLLISRVLFMYINQQCLLSICYTSNPVISMEGSSAFCPECV